MSSQSDNGPRLGTSSRAKIAVLQGFSPHSTPLSTGVDRAVSEGCSEAAKTVPAHGLCAVAVSTARPVENCVREPCLYWPPAAPGPPFSCSRRPPKSEADLPAQRAPAEAQARFPRAHVHPCRPRDPQAPPREGPEAALRLAAATARAAPPPSLPLAGLRRRLPPRPLGLDALPRPLLVPARRRGRAAARARRAEGRGHRRWSGTGSSGGCARPGARGSAGSRPAATTC